MNRSIAVLAGATVLFASASAYLWKQERAGRERNVALTLRVQELERNSIRLNPFTVLPPASLAPLDNNAPPTRQATQERSALTNAPPAAEANAQVAFVARGGFVRNDIKLMSDPEYRNAMRAQHRLMLSDRYIGLRDALHLQPDEADKLLDLLADQQTNVMANRLPFPGKQPDPKALREWQQKMGQQRRNDEAQIAALLGDAGMQQWKEYQSSEGARMQVNQLRQVLASSSEPLRQDQVQPLVKAIVAEQRRQLEIAQRTAAAEARQTSRSERIAQIERAMEEEVRSNERLHDTATQHLSAQQMDEFDRVLQQRVEMQRISVRMMRAREDAEKAGEVSTDGNFVMSLGEGTIVSRPP